MDRTTKLLAELEGIERINTARGYAEAIGIMDSQQQDIVLFELSLQDKSGFDLLAHIKRHHPKARTIIMTNLTGKVYEERCREMGADHFIDKSNEFDKILRILQDRTVALTAH